MSAEMPGLKQIVISGDITIDWNLIFFQGSHDTSTLWSASNIARACPQPGGAAMLAELMKFLCPGMLSRTAIHLIPPQLPEEPISSGDQHFNHSYAIWENQGEKEKKGWRVSQFLGIDPATVPEDQPGQADPERADLVLLDDSNLGFRHQPQRWPKAIRNVQNMPWVLLKLSYKVAEGELLDYLANTCPERVIAVVAAEDLRLSNAQISRGLSWERIAQDTLWELSYNPSLSLLAKCAHVIVSYQTDGAVLLSHNENGLNCQLIFDPNTIENSWSAGFKGGMVGYNTCLAAALARSLLAAGEPGASLPTLLTEGTRAGLSAMRTLHSKGYQNGNGKPQEAHIAFPYELIAANIEQPTFKYGLSEVRDPLGVLSRAGERASQAPRSSLFTILSQQCCGDLVSMARNIVVRGPEKALENVPLGRFGKLLTVDRSEIESYRTIAALVQEYINQEKADKPVSIAVFGAPGAGKSFGIKEIANSLSDRIKEVTFNLSQMNSPSDLIGALHQVRDEALRGKIPLVFWDEFDTSLNGTPLGWLRYFLAPMQDGAFLEGQVTHPIGRAIFIFAGGTCERMEDFGAKLNEDPKENDKLFRAVKGPDFKSRLKGFINILGPNPQKGVYDPYFIIRRAILLNSLLHRLTPQFFTPTLQMDDPLLDAFLEVGAYLHGVRSMESIIAMSQLSGKTRFERSCLPPVTQLNLHVRGWEFMARVQRLKLEGAALEKLARGVHEDFCEYMHAQGYVYGPKTDDSADPKTHSALVDYDALPEGEKEQNRQNALDIPRKLAQAGYVMIHARTNEPPRHFPDHDLDVLAQMEHVRWVKTKLALPGNWRYGPETIKDQHIHADLMPWDSSSENELAGIFSPAELDAMGRDPLSEAAREKDRELVRRIPYILGRVGYTVIKLEGGE
jgi:hypothetical protein